MSKLTPDPEKICNDNKTDIDSLINHLQDLLAGNPGSTYADAADLGYIRQKLVEAVAQFSRLSESDIFGNLEELRGE
jgi:hypothetical protein